MIENLAENMIANVVPVNVVGWLIMLEAICLSLIGGAFFVILKDVYGKDATKHLILSVIIGFWVWSVLGEPTASTIIPYGMAGALAPEVGRHLLKNKWWEKIIGGK